MPTIPGTQVRVGSERFLTIKPLDADASAPLLAIFDWAQVLDR